MKEEKTKEKVNSDDFNFEGAILYSFGSPLPKDEDIIQTDGDINFNKIKVIEGVWFKKAKIDGNALFTNAKIGGFAWFESAEIGRNIDFTYANVGKDAFFADAKIGGSVFFTYAKVDGDVLVPYAKINEDASFYKAEIGGELSFHKSKIDGSALFRGASLSGDADYILTHVKGIVDFRDAKFSSPKAQENACRLAKNQCIKFGDNHEADNYFYREMEGKRKQKLEIFRWPEYVLAQLIFGYGVKPLRTFCIWFLFIFTFAIIYFSYQTLDPGSEFIEYFYFSTTTAMTPGFGGYKISPAWQGLALVEAFFGTFMWAAFITIFARKYMR
ncbi:potassium channel family protein [Methanolacinia paynteri]|uniref:potassium channel family protein n=1 Tax=Methanolacinia paynteri TaxID=230356 RepID=UPI00064E244C|nr:potassium channel family protein [Methanolacinia paynteri]